MKLSHVPIGSVRINSLVKKSNGITGTIIAVQKAFWEDDDNQIEILWSNNKSTLEYQYDYDEVEYVEKD